MLGRKGFVNNGKEHEGRISYEWGMPAALSAYRDALPTTDPQTIILVEDTALYQSAEIIHPHSSKCRVNGYPKDSFHVCTSYKTGIQNILQAPGIDPIKNALLMQQFANLSIAQNSYIEKQREALE